MRSLARLAALLALGVGGPTAVAQPGEPVLHEFVPLGALRCTDGVCRRAGRSAASGGNPDAIEQDGAVVARPSPRQGPLPGEQILRPTDGTATPASGIPPVSGDLPLERRQRIAPDLRTDEEAGGRHVYHEVFDPAIIPHKRMTALDAAAEDETLIVADRAKQGLAVLGTRARRPGWDAFWGSALVDLSPGTWVPIPTVAAESRLLSYEVDPPAALEFARDGADNLYVRATVGGLRRLVWLTEAPRGYFGGRVPEGARLRDEPAGLVRPLPPSLDRRARRVLARLGIDPARRDQRLAPLLDRLVGWFRAFEMGPLPEVESSAYATLALGRRGYCRHRAYAFTITAISLGLPTRYLENELHAWVEVFVPGDGGGWRRIDLGGGSVDPEIRSLAGKQRHRPEGADPFPRPDEVYVGGRRPGGAPTRDGPPTSTPGGDRPTGAPPPSAPPAGRPARPEVVVDEREVFHGERLRLHGRLPGASGKERVAVELVGGDGLRVPIGDLSTAADGSFAGDLPLPATLPVGRYRVVGR